MSVKKSKKTQRQPGRPKGRTSRAVLTARLQVLLEPEVFEDLHGCAEAEGVTASDIMRELVHEYLEKFRKKH